jgi:hypothetical protein
MKARIQALLMAVCVVVVVFLGLAATAAHAAAASQDKLVTTAPGDPAPDPKDLKPPVSDGGQACGFQALGMNPGAAALCPLQLHGGFAAPGASTPAVFTNCNSRVFGDVLCVTCCTCVVFASGELDCQCTSDCIQIF